MDRFSVFDVDNHYYEPRDCFTRHIETEFADRAIRPVMLDDGREVIMSGDKRLAFPVAKFDRVEQPGAFQAGLTSNPNVSFAAVTSAMVLEPLLPEYQQRGPRVALMDRQGLEKALMFPTMGVTWEYELRHDVPTLYANLRSFNRWLEDEWGFGVDGRIYGVPLLSLFDLDRALTETHRLLEAGAKCINLRTGPVNGQSIAAPYFDPFWAILNEARIPVAFHICNSGYNDILSAAWGEVAEPNVREMSALQLAMTHCDRPMMDTLTACIMHNLFGRHPDLTVLSVEHGCGWVEYLLHALDHGAKMHRNGPWLGGPIDDRPSDIFKNHIKVNPFPEEDVLGLVRLLGAENVLFGSDYPHGEGINEPWEFTSSISTLADEEIHQIMRGNMDRIFASIA